MKTLIRTNSTPVTLDQLAKDRVRRFGDPSASKAQGLAALVVIDRGRRDGLDVSHYQGAPAWQLIAEAGYTWAATKATQGTGYVDPTLARNRAGMREARFRHRGLYHWLSPVGLLLRGSVSARLSSARKQAEHFLATVGTLQLGEFAMLDAEEEGITVDMVVEWCRVVEAATGRPVAVYTGVYVAKGTIWRSTAVFNGARARVLAAYTTEDRARRLSAPHAWDAWQWTGSGTIAGITTLVDIDQVDHHVIFDRACGLTDIPKGDDIVNVLIELEDADAKFIGLEDSGGLILQVQWTGPGRNPDGTVNQTTQARLAMLQAKNAPTRRTTVAGLQLATRIGPLPYGDTKHVWTGAEFAFPTAG